MEKKFKLTMFIVVACIGLFFAGFFAGLFIGQFGKPIHQDGSGYLDEFSREMGAARDFIAGIDAGLGEVQAGLTGIAGELGSDVRDLRAVAQRLYSTAEKVEILENDCADMRERIRSFLDDAID